MQLYSQVIEPGSPLVEEWRKARSIVENPYGRLFVRRSTFFMSNNASIAFYTNAMQQVDIKGANESVATTDTINAERFRNHVAKLSRAIIAEHGSGQRNVAQDFITALLFTSFYTIPMGHIASQVVFYAIAVDLLILVGRIWAGTVSREDLRDIALESGQKPPKADRAELARERGIRGMQLEMLQMQITPAVHR